MADKPWRRRGSRSLLARSLRQGLFAGAALLLLAGMLMKLVWDDEVMNQLLPLVFLISYECAAAGFMVHSTEAGVRRRLERLMGWLALLLGAAFLGRNNAQWLPLQSLLQLICAYKVYSGRWISANNSILCRSSRDSAVKTDSGRHAGYDLSAFVSRGRQGWCGPKVKCSGPRSGYTDRGRTS